MLSFDYQKWRDDHNKATEALYAEYCSPHPDERKINRLIRARRRIQCRYGFDHTLLNYIIGLGSIAAVCALMMALKAIH